MRFFEYYDPDHVGFVSLGEVHGHYETDDYRVPDGTTPDHGDPIRNRGQQFGRRFFTHRHPFAPVGNPGRPE